jgi:hypothetical protein
MADKFDIIEYLSGLTGFVFDKAVLKRIAYDRDVMHVTSFGELSEQQRDLLRADLLYTAYISPNVWASSTQSHGSFTKTIGSQTIYTEDKERLYNAFISVYKKYNDAKLEEVEGESGNLQWIY